MTDWKERALAAEARERAKDEALRCARPWLTSRETRERARVVEKIDAALAQQPADRDDQWGAHADAQRRRADQPKGPMPGCMCYGANTPDLDGWCACQGTGTPPTAQQPADQQNEGDPMPPKSRGVVTGRLHNAGRGKPTDDPDLADQPAQGEQERFERVTKQVVYSIADFCSLEIPDAAARSIAREILRAVDRPAQGERLDGMADLSQERLLADAYARGQRDMQERAAQVADARREQWSSAGGFGGHSAAARIIAGQIRNLRGDT